MIRLPSKILVLILSVCILGGGIAPANASCTADCCVQPESQSMHSEVKTANAGLLPSCCAGSENAPCPHMLESNFEIKDYAISAATGELNPVTAKLTIAASDTFFLGHSYHHVATPLSPPIRGPGVPLYLQNLSLLI